MSKQAINKPEGVRVAIIVPAFNEEKNIRRTIQAIRAIPEIDEFVVVSDGSDDRTAEIVLEEWGVELVDLKENVGKGGALRAGLNATEAQVILILDADLIGLTKEHVALLLQPVLDGRAKTTMGVFREGRVATDIAQIMAPKLSGQRAFVREILENVPMDDARYGVEVAVNRYLEENNIPIFYIDLFNLSQQIKEEKMGVVRGLGARAVMYYEVAKTFLTGKPK